MLFIKIKNYFLFYFIFFHFISFYFIFKLKSEIKIHKSLFHSNIVKFEHVFEDNHNVYILLEICKNKTLNEIIKKRKTITEVETKFFLDQILKAVR